MSTMVLSRKQSVFGTPSLSASAGAPEPLDRSKFEENEDIVVMETKLKILEILQVARPGPWWEGLETEQGRGSRYRGLGGVNTLTSQDLVLGVSTVICCVVQWFSKCGPWTSISLTWELRKAHSSAPPQA